VMDLRRERCWSRNYGCTDSLSPPRL